MLNVTQMLKIQENVDSNILVFYKHAMLSLLEFLFQGYHQYAQFRGSFISFIHASFVEQTLVFWSNMLVQHTIQLVRTNTRVIIDIGNLVPNVNI